MAHKAPGKSHRKGLSVKQLLKMFPTEDAARGWLESEIWPDGPYCPHCGSFNVHAGIKHSSMTHRCRDCPNRPQFSLKTGTVMKGTKLEYRDWGDCGLFADNEPQGGFQHETASRPGYHPRSLRGT